MIRLNRTRIQIVSERMRLRPPVHADFLIWCNLRRESLDFLQPWEPTWAGDHLSRRGFTNRVHWARRSIDNGTAMPLFLFSADSNELLGALTLDNIRRGPAQAATLGYWIGKQHARKGYMREAIRAVTHHAFKVMDLSRIEAACLPENTASRGVLESSGFKYEGVAQSYLQINGRWRNHVLYANLRGDRRGRTDVV
ncbi:GNAT family N-acetyltransferase [Meridianimarinicoccus aquatilis]|uniref:N-acetyltransferase n=1 Tax=Meridianimarinicoccus aquatilis TaxID=2552766 RepID=A0A4R6B462_9RHOB|nr:GNAT family protein [Fluviibacterium aquatile]QIE40635.1 GNAT family N-acetyltransferase [Rhodobacteraceae bacterium SC52]TDL91144.1 N-acetyltransferase [Fluviibacterium aquatile]